MLETPGLPANSTGEHVGRTVDIAVDAVGIEISEGDSHRWLFISGIVEVIAWFVETDADQAAKGQPEEQFDFDRRCAVSAEIAPELFRSPAGYVASDRGADLIASVNEEFAEDNGSGGIHCHFCNGDIADECFHILVLGWSGLRSMTRESTNDSRSLERTR